MKDAVICKTCKVNIFDKKKTSHKQKCWSGPSRDPWGISVSMFSGSLKEY